MIRLLRTIAATRACLDAARVSTTINGFKRGQLLAKLTAKLRSFYKLLANFCRASNPRSVELLMCDAAVALDVIWYAAEHVLFGDVSHLTIIK